MPNRRGLIAMYHGVCIQPASLWDVSPQNLVRHVRVLREHGLRVGSLDDLLDGGDNVVALTFDDAHAEVYQHAWPVLAELGVTATVFVPVNFVGGMNTYDRLFKIGPVPPRAVRIMTWSQLRELAAAGWSIQSHSCSHLPLSCLDIPHLGDELGRSKATLEDHIGAPVTAFAYPFGIPGGAETAGMLERTGYRLAVLADGGWALLPPPRPYHLPRVPVSDGELVVPAFPPAGD